MASPEAVKWPWNGYVKFVGVQHNRTYDLRQDMTTFYQLYLMCFLTYNDCMAYLTCNCQRIGG